MRIIFNQADFDLRGNTVEDLLTESKSDKNKGFVVVVNKKVVLKHHWESSQLKEADVVQTILPVHGG